MQRLEQSRAIGTPLPPSGKHQDFLVGCFRRSAGQCLDRGDAIRPRLSGNHLAQLPRHRVLSRTVVVYPRITLDIGNELARAWLVDVMREMRRMDRLWPPVEPFAQEP